MPDRFGSLSHDPGCNLLRLGTYPSASMVGRLASSALRNGGGGAGGVVAGFLRAHRGVTVTVPVFGVMAFSRSHNPHHLGPLAMGLLLGAALAIPRSQRSLT